MSLVDAYDQLPADDIKAALRPFLVTLTTPAFGSVSKREIDLAAFEMFRALGLIDKRASIFTLMTRLGVTRAKAVQLLFDIEVRSRGRDTGKLDEEVREALKATRFAKDGDFFILELENPLVQAHLRNRLRELGHITDTSFNTAIVRMPVEAATELIVAMMPADSQAEVRRALIAAGAPDRSLKGVLTSALKSLGAKILGDAADDLAGAVVDGASGFLAPIFQGDAARITEVWQAVFPRQAADQ